MDFNWTNINGDVAEEYFTSRSMIDVKELKENHPDSALVLDTDDGKLPNITDLSYQKVPVHDVQVNSYILVGAGEVCDFRFLHYDVIVIQRKTIKHNVFIRYKNCIFIFSSYFRSY